ncbi:MAG TPA: citrate (Si)-synthase, partial [Sphaerochaeta sp.]|nr:citrate (Si)-synthase [Sphaerochaeta sp.]
MSVDKDKAHLILPDQGDVSLNVITDNMGNHSIDIEGLRKKTGYITYDPGFMNTGSCKSSICYIDGEKGILRYRGYDIEDLVENCDFIEVAHLLVKGTLPNASERKNYQELLNKHSMLHYNMRNFFRSYPADAHPMSILASMVASLSAFYPEMEERDPEENIDLTVTRLIS